MDPTSSDKPSPLRVAAVVAFYMFAALVVCPFGLAASPHQALISLLDGLCVRFSVRYAWNCLTPIPHRLKKQGCTQFLT